MRQKVLSVLYKLKLTFAIKLFHRFVGKSKLKYKKKSTNITTCNSVLYKCNIVAVGENNVIEIKENSFLEKTRIKIKGNNNKVFIDSDSFVCGMELSLEGNNNVFVLGKNFFICDKTYIAIIDGTKFIAGNGGMFSTDIHIRTSDSHSIIDMETGKRINFEQDIILHDNVWLGYGVTILKGSEIADNCIVGAKSLVTKKFPEPNCVIAGNPAKVVKKNVRWKFERVKP